MDALQSRARHEIVRLERGLVVLEIIVGIAPLLGLVGTIIGMMSVFGDIGQSGLTEAAKLAQGRETRISGESLQPLDERQDNTFSRQPVGLFEDVLGNVGRDFPHVSQMASLRG